jgi:hypothetical protein
VKKNPKTQPYNNSSVILAAIFNGSKLLFPADAGTEALSHVGPEWNHLLYSSTPAFRITEAMATYRNRTSNVSAKAPFSPASVKEESSRATAYL